MPTDHPPLSVRHRPWAAPLRRPRMSNAEDVRPGLGLTSRYLTRDGVPLIPVSGELHYSRVPRARWAHRLRQMRAGGVTVVSSYVFWLHHVEHRDEPRFDGNLDVAAFVDLAAEAGLDVMLRIGPWCHGETRNGGFPDWVQRAPVRHRTDDPAYLDMVRDWYGQLAIALGGRCRADGPVLAIQLENELYEQPGHLVTLKRLAREAGMAAPLWVATAWGGADLPAEEVLPLYGGYGDGFWVDADAPWDPTFRDHFFFSHTWDDPGIGADVRRAQHAGHTAVPPRSPSTLFPPATCELGGGMGTAYHRRPRPAALDIAAAAHCKIGNGSAWQGYYMYAGGTNPPGDHGMQESHATGYPNDLPRLGYDFHAPIGEAGTLQPSHAELRRQHAYLAAFGAALAEMPSTLPSSRPSGVEDAETLRWALRSDGDSGFLFLAWHQPHVPLATYRGARFRVELDGSSLLLPSRPVDIPPGTLARWPLRFTAGGVRLNWATASALTLLPGAVPTLVLTAEPGIDTELALDGGELLTLTPDRTPVRLTAGGGALDVLLLDPETARTAWVCEDGGRRLLLSADELSWGPDGRVTARGRVPSVQAYDPATRRFADLPMDPAGPVPAAVGDAGIELLRAADTAVPVSYGKHDGRPSAPSPETFSSLAAVYRLTLPGWDELDVLLDLAWAGDVAELRIDGRTATDRFWDGSAWTVNLRDAGYRPGAEVTVHILPLAVGSTVHLPRDARDRLLAADGQLVALDRVRVTGLRTWHERRPS
ncbi:beta-galactosidase [Nucisporomicrobium flavum]|uniref:beta-galactosidase n=1 Tax=Nucisporomicrobium flavum TaxID=2785915 RepID=UPI001F2C700D|nr:beta-galactosidase [Nucisporomicrobium flavum]